ncbi:aspartate dehydrogenase [Bacillaceae bacterium W0354]
MNIGLIGAGAIANYLLKEVNNNKLGNLRINSILVRDKEKYEQLESSFGVKLFTSIDQFLDSDIDIVVEAANIEAVKELIPTVVKRKAVVLISIGALADEVLLKDLSESKNRIYLPSGGIGGLDLLQNANSLGTVTDVLLTTRKPASSLIDQVINEEKIVFEGRAVDAIKKFPKNMNISIVLSLAGIGSEKTRVRLVADPQIDKNVHHVEVKGDFGEASFTISNNPLPENPKTSYIAAMSILGTLKRLEGNIYIGG